MSATAAALESARSLVEAARTGTIDEDAARRLASLDPVQLADALRDPSDRIAFWVNVYNGSLRARLVRDPRAYERRWRFFAADTIVVAGQRLSPNAIEHGILRRSAFLLGLGYVHNPLPSSFERLHRVDRLDPRIHFVLNCGARSCPPLSVCDPAGLDAQLDAATRSYLASETAVVDDGRTVIVPRLMRWYQGDFGGGSGIVAMLVRHGVLRPGPAPRVRFGAYDWTLAVDPVPGASTPTVQTRVAGPCTTGRRTVPHQDLANGTRPWRSGRGDRG